MGESIRETMQSGTGAPLDVWLWLPEGQPRGVVQLVHGMAEHIARYDATAKRLNQAGYAVVGHTQLGHGEQAELLGWFASRNGWDALLNDIHALRTRTEQRFPGVPYFLLGHSMGSFETRTYCLGREQGLCGVILSGTGHFEPPLLYSALFLANAQCVFGGALKPSHLLETMSFAGYNKEWTPPRTAFDWLSTDPETVDRYIADPYCGFPFTAAGYRDMFRGLMRMAPANLGMMDPTVPVLLFSGEDDPVGARGNGPRTTARELRDAGVKDVTLRLYPGGRHEMFNETERETVWADLIGWLDSKAGKAAD